jgi:hypothetical protein
MSKKLIQEQGFTGAIGYRRRLFYIKLSQFAANKPSRAHVFNVFKSMLNLSRIVVSYGSCEPSPHDTIEIYLEFDEEIAPCLIGEAYKPLLEQYTCKKEFIKVDNAKSKLVYITRKDIDAEYEGCDSSDFSENFRMLTDFHKAFTSSTEQDFITLANTYKKSTNYMKNLYNEYCLQNTLKIEHYLIKNKYSGWQKQVVDWYNNFIVTAGTSQQVKQLYLHGESGLGKSAFISHLFLTRFGKQVFRPLTGDDAKKYQWEKFSSKTHNLVLVDEFDIREFNLSNWKQACEGVQFHTLVRNSKEAKAIEVKCPIIMISNQEPLEHVKSTIEHDPILKRIIQIKVDIVDDTGKQQVEYLANIDSEVGLTLEEIMRLSDNEKTTLTLARIRNEKKQSLLKQPVIHDEPCMLRTSGSAHLDDSDLRIQPIEIDQFESTNMIENDSALSLNEEIISNVSSISSKLFSLEESIMAANYLSIEQLEDILNSKKRKSDNEINEKRKKVDDEFSFYS